MAPRPGFPELPQEFVNSTFILAASVTAKEGKAQEVKDALAKIRKRADSSEESKTLTYRTTQSVTDPNSFTVFEEYEGEAGLDEHVAAEPFQALVKSGNAASVDIKYFKEFK